MRQSSCSRTDASRLLLGLGRWATCICHRKRRYISRRRAARYCCSGLPRQLTCSTSRVPKRSDSFTLLADNGQVTGSFDNTSSKSISTKPLAYLVSLRASENTDNLTDAVHLALMPCCYKT